MKEPIAVIGGGSWGTTLAKIGAENGCQTLLWVRDAELAARINDTHQNDRYLPGVDLPESLEATTDINRVCSTARVIFLVVPSHGMRRVAYDLGAYLNGEHVLVHAVKGIEQGTFKRMSDVIREETCVRKIGVISGPNLAKELANRHPAGTLVASKYSEVFQRSHDALHCKYFRVYWGHDVVGAEVAGAFKNIVALAAGIATGLGFGDNTKALLLTRGLNEMARLGVSMGADALTFGGMAGVGDLIATCSSPLSRNHQVGARLAKGEALEAIQADMNMVAEGVKTVRAVHSYCQAKGLDLPIVRAVYRRLYEGRDAEAALADLMSIPTGEEFVAFPS